MTMDDDDAVLEAFTEEEIDSVMRVLDALPAQERDAIGRRGADVAAVVQRAGLAADDRPLDALVRVLTLAAPLSDEEVGALFPVDEAVVQETAASLRGERAHRWVGALERARLRLEDAFSQAREAVRYLAAPSAGLAMVYRSGADAAVAAATVEASVGGRLVFEPTGSAMVGPETTGRVSTGDGSVIVTLAGLNIDPEATVVVAVSDSSGESAVGVAAPDAGVSGGLTARVAWDRPERPTAVALVVAEQPRA